MDQAKAWTRVRGNLRLSAGQRLFDQWLKPIVLIPGDDAETVRLGLPSAFMTNWVKNHYADRLMMEFRAQLPGVRTVSIETIDARANRELAAAAPVAEAATPAAPSAPAGAGERPNLDSRFTFDRFVVDTSNRLAFNAAKALAEPGKPRFSPLYLHSNTGQGKTHLMHAIGHAFMDACPDATAIYMPAERFMFEFVRAVREKDTFAFKARLRGVDLLMIDDLQFIAGKESTQEEFFHTVDEFMREGKRLVIAADRSPLALEGIETRLASRLGSGLAADIKPAELGLRRTILDRKLEDMAGAAVPPEVLDLLATRISSSIRELEGALNRLVAYSQLNNEVVTIAFAESVLGKALRGSQRRAVAIARPRQIAMYLAKRLTTRSLPEIGRKFGNRDHSTVIHAVRRIEELRGTDSEIDGAVRSLMRQLEA